MRQANIAGKAFLLSLIVEVFLISGMLISGQEPIVIGFFAICGWPIYFTLCAMWFMPTHYAASADLIKLQNNFNLDAMRRNSDQERYESWRKIK